MIKIYNYDSNGVHTGFSEIPDRPEGIGLPANCTKIPPLECSNGFTNLWDGHAWILQEDHREESGYINGTPHTIHDFGPLPEGFCTTPPPIEKPEAISAKLAEIMSGYTYAFAPLEAVYPASEREGWALQESEARAILANPAAETPVLSMMVNLRARGENVADLATKVLQHAVQYRMFYAFITGQQQRMYGEVCAFGEQEEITSQDIQAYPVNYIMPEGA